ncbi:MAG: succinate--CoA ligase subunit beta, partial [Myxococcota bacterium]|nr:succinate--CoA ligase subunit beta [Myxococcota bacterium]
GDLMALDAKMNFDDNAAFRHKDMQALRDLDEEDAAEIEASNYNLSYVKLDGDIGCMVNGAGLAMATMDIIKLHGGDPANFLDVGGGVNVESVSAAFKIILSDPNVKCVLVNIFGGIVRCDWIADGVLTAVKDVGIEVPLVVRLQGTKAPEARAMIAESGLPVITAEYMKEAAEKAIAAVEGV